MSFVQGGGGKGFGGEAPVGSRGGVQSHSPSWGLGGRSPLKIMVFKCKFVNL